MSSGERPIGTAKGKQSDTEALCQPPPPHTHTPRTILVIADCSRLPRQLPSVCVYCQGLLP